MSERIEQYKAEAKECERLAAEAQSPEGRASYQSLAQRWWELADQIKRLERERRLEQRNDLLDQSR